MSSLSLFFKKNKKQKENVKYAATKSLCDESGKPLEWTLRALTTSENDEIRDSCTIDVPITGKPNQFRPKLNTSKYLSKLISKTVVYPNLYDKELQDSYGVMTPEELIKEMIDDPGEYSALLQFVQKLNGFTDINSDIEEAKN
jgi:hypothetical protein